MTYLASPEAATVWAKLGGFTSPNKNVKLSSYSDPLQRRTAGALANASTFRFDLSDLQPAAFGGGAARACGSCSRTSSRIRKNVNGIAASLEKSAAAAYKK